MKNTQKVYRRLIQASSMLLLAFLLFQNCMKDSFDPPSQQLIGGGGKGY
jgi:hypothetical protein